jgi:hypothetical protein
MLTELAEGRHSGGQSVEGLRKTLAALATGRVRLLLLAADAAQALDAWFGPGPADVAYRSQGTATGAGSRSCAVVSPRCHIRVCCRWRVPQCQPVELTPDVLGKVVRESQNGRKAPT